MERILWLVGAAALAWCVFVISASHVDEMLARRELARRARSAAATTVPALPTSAPASAFVPRPAVAPLPPLVRGDIVGRIDIDAIGLSAVAREGDDPKTLRFSLGHVPGTAVPPEPGNAAFAGHRDRQFRRLGRLRPGDVILVTTETREFRYRVEGTSVVPPDADWVLRPTPKPTLTLVTCYPFGYVGNAPDRFVARAKLAD